MKAATIKAGVWSLIYGGLLLACLALFVARIEPELGWTVASSVGGLLGAGLLGAGLLLICLRSRLAD